MRPQSHTFTSPTGTTGAPKIGGFDVKELAKLLVARGMDSGMVVRLVACKTGEEVAGKDSSMAQRLAIEFHGEPYKLDNIAVKGTPRPPLQDQAQDDERSGWGVTGAYTLTKHPRSDPKLAQVQKALMEKIATHLGTLLTQSTDVEYWVIQKKILRIFDVFEARKDAESSREKIASSLAGQLAKHFKVGARTKVIDSHDYFTGVMKRITAIAATPVGRKSLRTAQGGSKSFADLVNESTNTYLAECKQAIRDWLASIATAESRTTTKIKPGNIAYKFGTPDPAKFSEKYTEAKPAGAVAGRLPDRDRTADTRELAELVEATELVEAVELVEGRGRL